MTIEIEKITEATAIGPDSGLRISKATTSTIVGPASGLRISKTTVAVLIGPPKVTIPLTVSESTPFIIINKPFPYMSIGETTAFLIIDEALEQSSLGTYLVMKRRRKYNYTTGNN